MEHRSSQSLVELWIGAPLVMPDQGSARDIEPNEDLSLVPRLLLLLLLLLFICLVVCDLKGLCTHSCIILKRTLLYRFFVLTLK